MSGDEGCFGKCLTSMYGGYVHSFLVDGKFRLSKCLLCFQSIEFGRPPSFPLTSVDCEQPLDDEADLNEAGEHVESGENREFGYINERTD